MRAPARSASASASSNFPSSVAASAASTRRRVAPSRSGVSPAARSYAAAAPPWAPRGLGPGGGPLQRVGESCVGRGGGEREVPGPSVALLQHLADRPVGGQPLLERGPLEDGRAQQRVPEGEPAVGADGDQSGPFGGLQRFGARPER